MTFALLWDVIQPFWPHIAAFLIGLFIPSPLHRCADVVDTTHKDVSHAEESGGDFSSIDKLK